MVGRCGPLPGPLSVPLLAVLAFRQQGGHRSVPGRSSKAALFLSILPVLKEFSGISGAMTGPTVVTVPRPNPVVAGWLERDGVRLIRFGIPKSVRL